ncbi:uncharacterized protein [Phaseolus vulgaris]|uniref:uncharacterized protein isoform X2 n=1 Tax=Phaseolus vulgaris TaxID=3885 RepID=UPI0035CC37E7
MVLLSLGLKVDGLKPIADELGVPLSQLAIAWCAANSNVSSIICGATKESQLHNHPTSQLHNHHSNRSWEECLLGYEESSSSKHLTVPLTIFLFLVLQVCTLQRQWRMEVLKGLWIHV